MKSPRLATIRLTAALPLLVAPLLVVPLILVPLACSAQSYGGLGSGQGAGAPGGPSGLPGRQGTGDDDSKGKKEDKPDAPPAAIPGAEPDADASIIPADRLAAEMSPNDALFDAITRGDLTAAKDALNRGAQLDSRNVLGQTPTDAAIDLNRNDITFLLLSMRGAAPAHGAHGVQTAQVQHQADGHADPHGRHGRAILQARAQKQAARPMLSADRGTPNPSVGFTGF